MTRKRHHLIRHQQAATAATITMLLAARAQKVSYFLLDAHAKLFLNYSPLNIHQPCVVFYVTRKKPTKPTTSTPQQPTSNSSPTQIKLMSKAKKIKPSRTAESIDNSKSLSDVVDKVKQTTVKPRPLLNLPGTSSNPSGQVQSSANKQQQQQKPVVNSSPNKSAKAGSWTSPPAVSYRTEYEDRLIDNFSFS